MRILFLFLFLFSSLLGKRILIFGVTGQEGAYLSRYLLEKGYQVHGVKRKSSSFNTARIDGLMNEENDFFVHYGDVIDPLNVCLLINEINPDEIYNFSAQSHVGISCKLPAYTANVILQGTQNILEAIRFLNKTHKGRFYHASSSEMFGKVNKSPQNEETLFNPQSPYAIAKLAAHNMTRLYRDGYGIYASNGILFNHESPLRGETFVTKKITMAVARIKHGLQDILYLGNLDSARDFGYDAVTQKVLVNISEKYFRPCEVDILEADASKAYKVLGWKHKTDVDKLICIMIDSEFYQLGIQ